MPPARAALYAASLGLVILTLWSVMVRPLPLVWAALAALGYVGIVLGGVFVLRWRVFADATVRGPADARGVVLTFDDGPHPTWTPRILRILGEHGAPATFFVIASKAEQWPDGVRAIVDAGHTVGLHSYGHDRLFSLRGQERVRADLERGIGTLMSITGQRPTLFRPPVGHTNPIIARVADALDLTIVGWTVRGLDGLASARAGQVVGRVRRGLRDGAIIALHDSPERGDREPASVQALPAILDAIAAERLEVVPLAAWLADDGAAQVPSGSGQAGNETVKRAPPV